MAKSEIRQINNRTPTNDLEKYESEDSFRLSDFYAERMTYGLKILDAQTYRPEEQTIGFGSYVLVKRKIPVCSANAPKVWNIYWAKPNSDSKNNDGYDKYGRYGVEIHTPERVVLFPYEYVVITEEKLKEYISFGYAPMNIFFEKKSEIMTLALVEKSKNLCEEERQIIMSLQLDGLTENQACQEYFLFSHDKGAPETLLYVPSKELYQEILQNFGDGD